MQASKKSSRTSSNGRRKSAATGRTRTAEHGRRPAEHTITFLTQDELRRLFKVIKSKWDKAIFLVAYRHGLRASEIGLLQRADVDAKQGRISIHRLKGSISGVYPMQPDVLKAIRSYLRTRADESPYLFLSNRGVPISRYMLHHLMQTYGEVAGLPVEQRKFHCLKHSIATHLLDASCNGLQWKWLRTAINRNLGPDYLHLSIPSGRNYLPLSLQSAAWDCNQRRWDHITALAHFW